MKLLDIYSSFANFKTQMNAKSSGAVVDTDEKFYDFLINSYDGYLIRIESEKMFKSLFFAEWMYFKTILIKIMKEQEKEIIELITANSNNVLKSANQTATVNDAKLFIAGGGDNKMIPRVIDMIDAIGSLPNIWTDLRNLIKPLMANIRGQSSLIWSNNPIRNQQIIQEILEALASGSLEMIKTEIDKYDFKGETDKYVADHLQTIKGTDGIDGKDGTDGTDGIDGTNATNPFTSSGNFENLIFGAVDVFRVDVKTRILLLLIKTLYQHVPTSQFEIVNKKYADSLVEKLPGKFSWKWDAVEKELELFHDKLKIIEISDNGVIHSLNNKSYIELSLGTELMNKNQFIGGISSYRNSNFGKKLVVIDDNDDSKINYIDNNNVIIWQWNQITQQIKSAFLPYWKNADNNSQIKKIIWKNKDWFLFDNNSDKIVIEKHIEIENAEQDGKDIYVKPQQAINVNVLLKEKAKIQKETEHEIEHEINERHNSSVLINEHMNIINIDVEKLNSDWKIKWNNSDKSLKIEKLSSFVSGQKLKLKLYFEWNYGNINYNLQTTKPLINLTPSILGVNYNNWITSGSKEVNKSYIPNVGVNFEVNNHIIFNFEMEIINLNKIMLVGNYSIIKSSTINKCFFNKLFNLAMDINNFSLELGNLPKPNHINIKLEKVEHH